MSGEEGSLGAAVRHHSWERARHFFLFMAQLDMTCYERNRTTTGQPVNPAGAIREAATHQTDTGFKEKRSQCMSWQGPVTKIDEPVSSFDQQDATHFTNIGIDPGALGNFKGNNSSANTTELAPQLENIHGNTRMMPKIYNITVDRVIDTFHFDFAKRIIAEATLAAPSQSLFLNDNGAIQGKSWKPFATLPNIDAYRDGARAVLEDARDGYHDKGLLTEEDCGSVYIERLKEPDFCHEAFQTLHSNVTGDAVRYVNGTGAEAGPGGPVGLFFSMA